MQTTQDILDWFNQNTQWYNYFKELSQKSCWTHLYSGGWAPSYTKEPLSSEFQTEEDIISYFSNRIPRSYSISSEIIAEWIVYNLLNLKITNDFLSAAKDVEFNAINETLNVSALGTKYQTGWIELDTKGQLKLKVSFVFWGKGDGQKQNLNKNRLKCLISFLPIGALLQIHPKNLYDCANYQVQAHFEFQGKDGRKFQRTVDTSWADILKTAKDLNGII